MPECRDPRYRGRRRTLAQCRPVYLRTNYVEDDTPIYHIMNRLNADYNNRLWNRALIGFKC